MNPCRHHEPLMLSNHYSIIRPPERNDDIDQVAEVLLVEGADIVLGEVSEREEDPVMLELPGNRMKTRSMRRLDDR